jgi:arylsulfatase A
MLPMLLGTGESERKVMFFYRGTRLMAVRKGPWKAHFITQAGYGEAAKKHDPPLLFHLEHDPSEKYDVAQNHSAVIADIMKEVERHRATVKPVASQLEIRLPAKET